MSGDAQARRTGRADPAGGDKGDRSYPPSATAILDAAEELFCARGFSAVSMRDIAAASGQHLSSANYYFGSKAGLFEAAFLRRIVPVNRRRLELLDRSLQARKCDLPDVVEAYLRPLFEDETSDAKRRARLIMLFSKQLLSNPDEHSYLQSYYEEVSRRFIRQIHAARPAMDITAAIWGYNYMIGILVFTLAGTEPMARLPEDLARTIVPDRRQDQTVARLKAFICAGLEAFAETSQEVPTGRGFEEAR